MKKRILAMIFVLALCFCTVIPAFAVDADGFVSEYERVQDMAQLLSESEREALIKTLDELSERQKMDVIVVTTKTLDGKKPMEYADDIYDYCKYGYGEKRDGLLFLVSMEDRDWWISTCGYGITAFTDAGIQYIGEQMVEDLGDGNYAAAFNTFAELSDDFITKSREGEPYDKSNLPKGPSFDSLDCDLDFGGHRPCDVYSRQDEGTAQDSALPGGGRRLYEERQP